MTLTFVTNSSGSIIIGSSGSIGKKGVNCTLGTLDSIHTGMVHNRPLVDCNCCRKTAAIISVIISVMCHPPPTSSCNTSTGTTCSCTCTCPCNTHVILVPVPIPNNTLTACTVDGVDWFNSNQSLLTFIFTGIHHTL